MKKYLVIKSTDNTNVLIRIDKIQFVIQEGDSCIIALDNGNKISTGAEFNNLYKSIVSQGWGD